MFVRYFDNILVLTHAQKHVWCCCVLLAKCSSSIYSYRGLHRPLSHSMSICIYAVLFFLPPPFLLYRRWHFLHHNQHCLLCIAISHCVIFSNGFRWRFLYPVNVCYASQMEMDAFNSIECVQWYRSPFNCIHTSSCQNVAENGTGVRSMLTKMEWNVSIWMSIAWMNSFYGELIRWHIVSLIWSSKTELHLLKCF